MPSSSSCGSFGRSMTSTPTSPSPTASKTYSPSCVVLKPTLAVGSSRYGFPLGATPNLGCSEGATIPASRKYQVGNNLAARERTASSGCRNRRTRSWARSGRWCRSRSKVCTLADFFRERRHTSSGTSCGILSEKSRTILDDRAKARLLSTTRK